MRKPASPKKKNRVTLKKLKWNQHKVVKVERQPKKRPTKSVPITKQVLVGQNKNTIESLAPSFAELQRLKLRQWSEAMRTTLGTALVSLFFH